MIQVCICMDEGVKSYLEKTISNPDSRNFGSTYSHIVNVAVRQYASVTGYDIQLRPPKRGRPPEHVVSESGLVPFTPIGGSEP